MRSVVVLGATGSIGRQTLEVADRLDVPVSAVVARHASDDLAVIASQYPDAAVVAVDPDAVADAAFTDRFGGRYSSGVEAMLDCAAHPNSTVVNGVVGAAGLEASIVTLDAGNRLGLANKESLVAGGPLVLAALASGDGEMIPIDSEHSALFQCLVGENRAEIDRLLLTASGGPFRGRSRSDLVDITAEQALAHPTWDMGPRISIDSATLVNKGLEVIEAHFLFGLGYDQIDVVVHPESIVHSLVEFRDGSLKAHVGATDMRIPIQYAITYPSRVTSGMGRFELAGRSFTFDAPDRETFPALDLAYAAGRAGGTSPAVFNAVDEVAVQAFLDARIAFLDIAGLINDVLDAHETLEVSSLDVVRQADQWARNAAEAVVVSR